MSPAEWAAKGKAARRLVPRSSHAGWAAAADRPDPVALLEEQAEGRVPELVPISYGLMHDFYVRQLHDWKGSVEVESMRAPGLTLYARLCGATLARAHARLGDRVAIAAYLGTGDAFDRAIAGFSVAYADQNERDYEAFHAAVRSGRLQAETGL